MNVIRRGNKGEINFKSGSQVQIIEIGGTVGDIESLPFLEAIRQIRVDIGRERVMYIHLTLLPYLQLGAVFPDVRGTSADLPMDTHDADLVLGEMGPALGACTIEHVAACAVMAGFSQGGAITLQCGLRHPQRLAGLICWSTYLPRQDTRNE